MDRPDSRAAASRRRREPPTFRGVEVRRVQRLSPRLTRVTLAGPELEGLTIDQPAASVRLLLPPPGEDQLVTPRWNGNEFLLPDGRRPLIRTFTPRRNDQSNLELDLDIVLHGGGAAGTWAEGVEPGATAGVSGPGRGYTIDPQATGFLLAGDETAIPAISQLLEALPEEVPIQVHIEVAQADARLPLPDHPRAGVTWHDLPDGASAGDTLLRAIHDAGIPPGTRLWVAGEAAGVQRIRRHLAEERGVPRSHATVRGYWKHGRTGDGGDPGGST